MKYAYYPGCSLAESAREYDLSVQQSLAVVGVELAEIPGWTCCGASAAESVSKLLSLALPARNLALAERHSPGLDVLAPCSACYLNLRRVQEKTARDRSLLEDVNSCLDQEDLHYAGQARARHLLDVLVNDVGLDAVHEKAAAHYAGLVVAPYTGCQAVRPYRVFDDPEQPWTLSALIEAMGMQALDWSHGAACCSASLTATKPEAGLAAVADILDAAQEADCIATVCPMCQMNLELYQHKVGRTLPVVYVSQLMCLAFGLDGQKALLGKNLSAGPAFINGLAGKTGAQADAQAP